MSDRNITARHRPGGLVGEAALVLYGAAGRVAEPLARSILSRRERGGKEIAERRSERFGRPSRTRPAGPLIWAHAASVGETVSALPLIERLCVRGQAVLLTTSTITAAQLAERRLGPNAFHQFVPIDTPDSIDRFLSYWRPGLVLFAESELWPNTLRRIARSRVPLVVVNARMSERSFRAWRALVPLARAVLGRTDLCLAQSHTDAERLTRLGASRVEVCGNLKFDAPPPPADAAELARLRSAIANRPVLVAASTHPGEEAAVIAAHLRLAAAGLPLLTIIAPRHPERGEAVAAEATQAGLRASRRALDQPIAPNVEVYVADTIGEMGLWYRLADVAFLGGSIVSHGGQNPIEPAKLGVPIVHGGSVENFREVYEALGREGAAVLADGPASLLARLDALFGDAQERARLAVAARLCIGQFTGALDRTVAALRPYLDALHEPGRDAHRA